MNTTQDHIPIKEFEDDIVFLKDGSGALILQVSAVNFGLLSEREQAAIIASFAQMLNSLSFSIQIVIYSKRLNISSYLSLLNNALKSQTNSLLMKMIVNYRQFIQTLIKENEVLDKKFYVVIPLFKLELGFITSKENLNQKIKTVLLPRRDQVIRQLARSGLKATQLTSNELIELFFDIYNEISFENVQTQPIQLKNPIPPKQPLRTQSPSPPASPAIGVASPAIGVVSKTHPFVVEELEET